MVKLIEGFNFKLARINGSHHIFKHEALAEIFVLPYRKPTLKVSYVKDALILIDEIIASDVEDEDE